MFISLLIATFVIASIVSFIAGKTFSGPVSLILHRIVAGELAEAWHRYVVFALYLVGINGGVRIWQLERYVEPPQRGGVQLVLDGNRWALEIYRTIMGSLSHIAMALLLFFVVALIGYIAVRGQEMRAQTAGRT